MLNRATLAVGEVTSGPAVTSTGAFDSDDKTIKDASSIAALARRVVSLVRLTNGTQTVMARQTLARVRARAQESASSFG